MMITSMVCMTVAQLATVGIQMFGMTMETIISAVGELGETILGIGGSYGGSSHYVGF